jgi:hypothetical protein
LLKSEFNQQKIIILEFRKVVGYPQVNGIVLFNGRKIDTNFPRLKFVKKRYEDTFKYFQKGEQVKQEIITQKLKGKDLIRPGKE